MKTAISPLAYLIDEELLHVLLDGLSLSEMIQLLKIGVDIIGLDRSIVMQAEQDAAVKDVIVHLASCFRGDEEQRLNLVKASLEYPNRQFFQSTSSEAVQNVEAPNVSQDIEVKSRDSLQPKSSVTVRAKSKLSFKPNAQQEDIINNCSKGIQVEAFAGAGKSTTCKMIMDELGHHRSLYTAFLSQNIEDAKSKITPNAVTQDGLANRFVLEHTKFKNIFTFNPRGGAPVYPMKDVLGFDIRLDIGSKKIKQYGVAKLINDTISNYCASSENEFIDSYVPSQVTCPKARNKIYNWAMAYWDYLLSGRATSEHHTTFNHLMKFWSLSPRITLPDEYQNIIIDEGQDINGAFYRVMLNHSDRQLTVVGDKYQELFKWRGAINSMDKFDKDSYPLEESYRFGNAIAEGSNKILAHHSSPPKHTLIGQSDIDSKIIFYDEGDLLPNHSGAILTRTRSSVISIADTELRFGNKYHIKTEFGPLKYIVKNILHFARGELDMVHHPYLLRCYSFNFLENELKDNPDADVYFGLKLYEKYKERVLEVIEKIERNSVPENDAMKIISTTHSIKGQEWDYVVISPDYVYTLEKEGADIDSELSVLYVGLTRAKKRVYVPMALKKYLL